MDQYCHFKAAIPPHRHLCTFPTTKALFILVLLLVLTRLVVCFLSQEKIRRGMQFADTRLVVRKEVTIQSRGNEEGRTLRM